MMMKARTTAQTTMLINDNDLLWSVFYQGLLLLEDGVDGLSCTLVTLTCSVRGIRAHVCDLQDGNWNQVRSSKLVLWPDRSAGSISAMTQFWFAFIWQGLPDLYGRSRPRDRFSLYELVLYHDSLSRFFYVKLLMN